MAESIAGLRTRWRCSVTIDTVALEDDLDGGVAEETIRFGDRRHRLRDRPERQEPSAVGQQLAPYPYYRTCPRGWQRTAVAAGADCGQPRTERGPPGLAKTAVPSHTGGR